MLKVKHLLFAIIPVLIFACIPKNQNVGLPDKLTIKIFDSLEKVAAAKNWGMDNEEKAQIFAEIYFQYSGEKDFEKVLMQYLDHQEKCYWIGIFADDAYYTSIADSVLSLKILEKGLELITSDQEKVRFLWVIGKKYYYSGDKVTAEKYLAAAYKLSALYPGNTPSWNSEQEYDEIMAFIKDN